MADKKAQPAGKPAGCTAESSAGKSVYVQLLTEICAEEGIRLVRECSSEIDRAEKTIRVIQDGEAAGLSGEGPDGETGAVSEEGRNRGTQAAPEENPDLDAETGAVPEADGSREAEA